MSLSRLPEIASLRIAGLTIGLMAALAVAPMGGCQSDSGQGRPIPSGHSTRSLDDPCATQLQNISGALLLYYAMHRSMPASLEDLGPLADVDAPLQFVCPSSGLPYVYNPQGLVSAGRNKRIIVYDAKPVHDGARWCILMAPPGANSSISVEVLLVEESDFKTYSPLVMP
jgi:hypothetical protein